VLDVVVVVHGRVLAGLGLKIAVIKTVPYFEQVQERMRQDAIVEGA